MSNKREPKDPGLCVGCSKPIERSLSRKKAGDQAVDIRVGQLLEDTDEEKAPFKEKQKWGRLHLKCFLRAMDSPDSYLAELGLL